MTASGSAGNGALPGAPQRGALESELADQQQALLDAIFAPSWTQHPPAAGQASQSDPFSGARGLLAYRSNAHAQAERTLLASFPVVAQLVGIDSFHLLARDFWHQHPPTRGDLAQWGEALAAFLQANTQLADEPYLGDVARVEWALHLAAGAADRVPAPASFALLSSTAPDALALLLSCGTAVVCSAYPVASIVTAHLGASPSLQAVGEKLRAREGECALVWRQGFKPRVAQCSVPEAALVQALLDGASLSAALSRAAELDFAQWLPSAVQSGLVLGAMVVDG